MDATNAGGSSIGATVPSKPPGESARRQRASERRERYEREAFERHQVAEQRADVLIRAACSSGTGRSALGDVARRVAHVLDVELCDLLILGSADRALLVEIRVPPSPVDAKPARERDGSAHVGATMRLLSVTIPPTGSPTAVLRGDGPANRVHVFIHHAGSLRTLGVLSIASAAHRQLTIEDRALANAIGDRLGVALAQGDFPGFH